MNTLPLELRSDIISYDDDDSNSMINTCALVCKDWCNAVAPLRWSTLTTTGMPNLTGHNELINKLLEHPDRANNVCTRPFDMNHASR